MIGETYILKLTKEEMELVQEIFSGLTDHNLVKWKNLIENENPTKEERDQRWKLARLSEEIEHKAIASLEEKTDELAI